MNDRERAEISISKVKAGHRIDYADARDIERHVECLEDTIEIRTQSLTREIHTREQLEAELAEYKATAERAISLLQDEIKRRDKSLTGLNERVEALERERISEEAYAQKLAKVDAETRKLRESLDTVRYDRDKLLELVRWWEAAEQSLKRLPKELFDERDRQLKGRDEGS